MAETPLHALALERFKVAAQVFQDQRRRELEDLRFAAGEQWPDDIKALRAGGQVYGTMPPLPARPCLTINKIRQPLQQVSNQQRQARLSLKFAPKGNGASREIAEAFEDIARAIQADSRAHIARNWAFDRAVTCGLGAYRILTDYANDGDFDLDIVYKRILNQGSVYLDPYAQEPDWSDGEWAFITEWMPYARYKRLYPKSKMGQAEEAVFSDLVTDQADWVKSTDDGESRSIQLAEYFYVVFEDVVLVRLQDGTVLPADEAPEGVPVLEQRTVKQRSVKWAKLNAIEVLEERDWLGRYIPIVPVIADEYNLNGERRWEGIVRPAMDAGRSYNVMRSAQVEAVGLAPKAPWILAEGQDESYEQMWQQANVRNFPYLKYRPVTLLGQPVAPPSRDVAEPAIQAITLAAHEADNDIKATTGIFDPSLGNLSPSDRSGKAILALQKQAEMGTAGYLGNLADMSMQYEGKVLRDLIPKVYDRPGRIVAAIGEDDQRRLVMLKQPFVLEGGQPRPPQPGEKPEIIDLSKGEYTVAVTIGKSHTTRREEGSASMGELLSAAPQLAPLISDLWVGDMDFPGARQIADRLKKTLPPQLQDTDNPQAQLAQAQAQMQQMAQVLELQSKELQAKTQIIETDQVKAQQAIVLEQEKQKGENERALYEAQAKQNIEFRKLEVQLEIEMAKLGSAESMKRAEIEQQELHAHSEQQLRQQELEAEQAQAEMDRQAERDSQMQEQAFQREEGEAGRQQERELTAAQLEAQRASASEA